MIDWTGRESHLLLNPRLPQDEKDRLEQLFGGVPSLRAHVWLATSGTTGATRLVALSLEAVLAGAAAANAHLNVTAADVWCRVLPTFHVGGLAIHARAWLSGSRVMESAWNAAGFARGGFTLSSLVPAQVLDLVDGAYAAPRGVRAIVVGGGRLAPDLLERASELGWPLLPSYGLTEAASQVATAAEPGRSELHLLSHLEARERNGTLEIRGPSLMTAYAQYDERGRGVLADPKEDGWFSTGDRGAVEGRRISVQGRGADFIKIGGESVDLVRLDGVLDSVRGTADVALYAAEDLRLGHVVELATTAEDASAVVKAFNAQVAPYERIRGVRRLSRIPRTALGKVRRTELSRLAEAAARDSTKSVE